MGINLKVMSVPKAKEPLKVSRANATLEHCTHSTDLITLFVYEECLERLSEEFQDKLIEGIISNISYDSEKDRIIIDNDVVHNIARMRRKYENYVDIVETASIVIQDIADEERRRKEEEKLRKKEEKEAKKRQG